MIHSVTQPMAPVPGRPRQTGRGLTHFLAVVAALMLALVCAQVLMQATSWMQALPAQLALGVGSVWAWRAWQDRCAIQAQQQRLTQVLAQLGGPLARRQVTDLAMAADAAVAAQQAVAGSFSQVYDDAGAIQAEVQALSHSASKLVQSAQQNETQVVQAAQAVMDLTMAIQESSTSVGAVRERAKATLSTARQGESMVEQAAMSMNSISESSSQVRGLIQTIEGIAFQTNLLALNAAVEAARAGSSGRGFAVVAGEVRSLSNRTSAAAGDVRRVIGNSVDELVMGTSLMKEAGDMMRNTVVDVHALAEELIRLDAAVGTQREQVEHINGSLIEFNEIFTHHAQVAGQTSATAQRCDTRAQGLLAHAGAHVGLSGGQP